MCEPAGADRVETRLPAARVSEHSDEAHGLKVPRIYARSVSGELLNVWEYERAAEERLEPGAFGYFAGGANDEWTLRQNLAAFARWVLRPRVLVDVSDVTTAVTVLGTEISSPVLVAPTAFQRMAHPEGETATARGAAAAGTIMCLSTIATATIEEVGEAAPEAPRWFQLYWSPDRGIVRDFVGRAEANGYRAIVLTVDLPVGGRRERDLRTGFEVPAEVPVPAFVAHAERAANVSPTQIGEVVDRSVTWRDLEWLRGLSPLPLVIKGLLTAEDAVLACESGAEAIVVSNHGGRQLNGVPASLDALPEVAQAVDGRAEVLMDGGIRRGTDVVKALALGAHAVLAGRAPLWGLAVDGAEGVEHVLQLLREEVALALALCGCASPTDVTRSHVGPAGGPRSSHG
jgi:isopentenyl diphosphate isomerase/L-lactate dehydrogenase-like FMN-dependent dehydrogenase